MQALSEFLVESNPLLRVHSELTEWNHSDTLYRFVESIHVGECSSGQQAVLASGAHVQVHLYKLLPEAVDEFTVGGDNDGEDEPVTAASTAALPRREYNGLWRK